MAVSSSNLLPKYLYRIWIHLGRRRHLQLAGLLVAILASGLAELVSLGAVLPFLAILSNPQEFYKHQLIQKFAPKFGFVQADQLILPVIIAFITASVVAAWIRLFNIRQSSRIVAAVGSDLSSKAYALTLYQPYQVHVHRNSSVIISSITQSITLTVQALNAALQILLALFLVVFLLFGLFLINWLIALSLIGVFSISYLFIALLTRKKLFKNGDKIVSLYDKRIKILQEGLGAIRDVLLDGTQDTYRKLYDSYDRPQRQLEADNFFLAMFPRYAIEALGMVVIAILGGMLVLYQGSGASVISLMGALALGAQRLLPALQQIYSGWTVITSSSAGLEAMNELLDQPPPRHNESDYSSSFKTNICLQDVCYRYTDKLPLVLQDIHLEIRTGDRIGIIGTTGSGKSTLVDVLMGLLPPTTGQLIVDGVNLYDPSFPERLNAWRSNVAHVPQNVYLTDNTIAANIAFCVPSHEIDFARIRKVAEQAQIASYIESLPNGYSTFVGERGVRMSGGQLQRIGIARALYKQANFIILDEATSALDSSTEMAVISAVEGLNRTLTLIMIAHRISTVQRCDRVIRLEYGSIIANGPPEVVLSNRG